MKIMRLLVMFDVPSETKADQKRYRKLIKSLEAEGFYMFEYSVYVRVCTSDADVEACLTRLRSRVAWFDGLIKALKVTDDQFSRIEILNQNKKDSSDIRSKTKRLVVI